MDTDLSSINTQLWTNIPFPLVQAIDLLTKTCSSHSSLLTSINKDLWFSEILASVKSLQRDREDEYTFNLNTSISKLQDHFAAELKSFKKNIRDAFDHLTQDLQSNKLQLSNHAKVFKSEVASLKSFVQSSKDSIKTDLANKYIKPQQETLKLEFTEVDRTLSSLEKQINQLSTQFEKLSHDTNSSLNIQTAEILQTTQDLQTINQKFNFIVQTTTEALRKDAEAFESLVKRSNLNFQAQESSFFQTLKKTKEEMFTVIDSKRTEMLQIHKSTKETHEKLIKEQTSLHDRCEALEHDLHFSLESLKIENKSFLLNAYEEAKDKLILTYREDLKLIKSKLEWLPVNSQQLSDLSPIEARLFILETRLRREENNRIQQKLEIMKEIGGNSKATTPKSIKDIHKSAQFSRVSSRNFEKKRFRSPEAFTQQIKYIL